MKLKLYIDDLRDPAATDEDGSYTFLNSHHYADGREQWTWVKTITAAIRLLSTQEVEEVSIDHDIMHPIPQQVTIPPGVDVENGHKVVELTLSAIATPLACPEDYTAVAHFIAMMPEDRRPKKVYVHTQSSVGSGRLHNILRGKVGELVRINL